MATKKAIIPVDRKPVSGKRNKRAGHDYERDEVNAHKKFFPHLVSTRLANRARDGQGIDICTLDESVHGRFPFDIQCKSVSNTTVCYPELLERIPDGRIKVVLHQRTGRAPGKTIFRVKGRYAILERKGYEVLLGHVAAIQEVWKTHPELLEAVEKKLNVSLIRVPEQTKSE